ncbi:capsule biosynthesis GfcC family protein [Deefgea tanakiae]|uniref:Capsule biosynthesis GfcC family protein n=1 Tax=Deefgea tanakiae TaxID=2865840 RepID=A0ABX8Z7L4_9NEIS|nr:capsule biosynthesis GfcC family protein [Deefgea tanakiae]QZA78302.1 capsule biosynthesis GfcC family protein [Deefgea tanakiae]
MIFIKFTSVLLLTTSLVFAGEIKINDKVISYPVGAKIEYITSQLLAFSSPYWPGSHIRNKGSHQESLALKADLVKCLQELMAENKDYKKVYLDVNYFNPFGRILINLDPDWFRLRPADNPLLSGDYEVSLNQRPKYVQVLGATKQSKKVRIANSPIHTGLIDRSLYLDLADLNSIYIIQPNGSVEKIGNAYWNYAERDLMPGSIIYVPIDESKLPAHMKNLNVEVMRLLASAEERAE